MCFPAVVKLFIRPQLFFYISPIVSTTNSLVIICDNIITYLLYSSLWIRCMCNKLLFIYCLRKVWSSVTIWTMEMSWPFMTLLEGEWKHVSGEKISFFKVYLFELFLSGHVFQVTSSTRIWSTIWAWGFRSLLLTTNCRRQSEPTCIVMLCLVSITFCCLGFVFVFYIISSSLAYFMACLPSFFI